ncbi:hypothetical protein CJF31_00010859 [Rutstroemia sp. NJR-2017a BVV2]|nr:hypothetical protein CJF31_00010859 [Rutstroemia sp. NJR-2017a BVV2]
MAEPNTLDMDIVSICFGVSIGFWILTTSKAARQTLKVWKRKHSIHSLYIYMIWMEAIVNLVIAIVSWLFIRGNIQASLLLCTTLFGVLIALQTQCAIQIIANRVGLIMVNKHKVPVMKWSLFVFVALINISVFIIWIPARMEVSPTWVRVNDVWDRIEKSLYLIIDGLLNAYFLYLVRSRLIAGGLTKYKALFNFNAGIVFVSLSMDLLLICLLSLPNGIIYVQFHPLAYIVKLNIELSMADLISKVVRRKDPINGGYSNSRSTELASHLHHQHFDAGEGDGTTSAQIAHIYANNDGFNDYLKGDTAGQADDRGIMKTVVTVVESANKGRKDSLSSSTRKLNSVESTEFSHNHGDETYMRRRLMNEPCLNRAVQQITQTLLRWELRETPSASCLSQITFMKLLKYSSKIGI